MTLILGLVCADGVVLASDSQATYTTGGQPVKGDIRKLIPQWANVAWAASGNVGVAQYVERLFREDAKLLTPACFENKNAAVVAKEIWEFLQPKLHEYFQSKILPYPGMAQVPGNMPFTAFLFCGWVKDGPLLFEIGADLVATNHLQAGYAAIGSGDIFPYFALASLRHQRVRDCPLSQAALIAHRVVDDAVQVAAYGLGPPVQMITIDQKRSTKEYTRDEIRVVEDGVAQWKRIESDALEKHMGGLTQPAPASSDQPQAAPQK